MSNEVEDKQDLSAEGSDASGDKIDDEANSSEDSQDNVSSEIAKEEDQNSVKDDDNEAKDSKHLDKPTNSNDTNDKKEKDEPTHLKNNIDEKDTKKESKGSKTDDDTENGEEIEEEVPRPKIEETPKKGSKKNVLPPKTSEQLDPKRKTNKVKDAQAKEEKVDVSDSKGMQLGEIPRVDASISRFKNDDLKLLYRLLFKTPGKTALIAKSIKKFDGFDFKKDTEEYTKKIESTKKFELKQLKSICEMLDLEKKGTKEEIAERIIDFLIEPKDSGKQAGGGRPKRTAAVRANNRGYSSHDDSYSSDERRASRASGRGKGKRTNLKDDTTSASDVEFHLSDTSDTKSRSTKRKKSTAKHVSDEENISEADNPSSDESGGDRKKRKTKKVVNSKPKPKATPGRRGRKPAAESEKRAAPTSKKSTGRKRAHSEESDAAQDELASSSEDEPLIKKAKSPQPPTDDEIKKYVKEILDGANLEEITMKTVCKQVYAHYPDFDLAHKKDFIKTTVKSLIST